MLYDTLEPTSTRDRDPRYGTGNLYFKKNGQLTGFGKGISVAVPAITKTLGTAIGAVTGMQGLGDAVGSLGTLAVQQQLRNNSQDLMQYRDSADGVTSALGQGAVLNELGSAVGGIAGGGLSGISSALSGVTTTATGAAKPKQPLPLALASVIPDVPGSENAVSFTGTELPIWQQSASGIVNPYQKPVYRFASGGFTKAFAAERAKQGAGGIFTYQGKKYTTNFKEEEQPDPATRSTPFPTPGATGLNVQQIKQKIAGVESGGSYSAINPASGALGKYQFLASTLRDYGVNPSEFLRSPGLQEQVMDQHIKRQLPTAMALMNRYGEQRNWGVGDYLAGIHLKGRAGLTRELATGRTSRPSRLNPSTDEYVSRTQMFFAGGPTIYAASDKTTEDLVMIDKKTGQKYGEMRYGEYILPQRMTVAAGAIMASSAPKEAKIAAIGKMVHGQFTQKPIDREVTQYAEGGPTPNPERKKIIDEIEAKYTNALLEWEKYKRDLSSLSDQKISYTVRDEVASFMRQARKNADLYKSQLGELKRAEAFDTGYTGIPVKVTKPSSSQITVGTNYSGNPKSNIPAPVTNQPSGPIVSSPTSTGSTVETSNRTPGTNRTRNSQVATGAARTDIPAVSTPASLGTTAQTSNPVKGVPSVAVRSPNNSTLPAVSSPASFGSTVGTNNPMRGVVSSSNVLPSTRSSTSPIITAPTSFGASVGRSGPIVPMSPSASAVGAAANAAGLRTSYSVGVNVPNPRSMNASPQPVVQQPVATTPRRAAPRTVNGGTLPGVTVRPSAAPAPAITPISPIASRPMSSPTFAQSGLTGTNLATRVNPANITPYTPPNATGSGAATNSNTPNFNRIGGDLMDIGKLALGASIAGKPIDSPTIPTGWSKYMGEVTQRKNQGLTPEEMALANNNMTNNYRQGVAALSQVAGGGSSPGTVLTGLTNLGLQRGNQSQNILAMDAQRREQNFSRFGMATSQTTAMEQGLQADRINRQTQDRATGLGLVQNALTGLQERDTYYQNQPLYDKYMQSLTDRENEASATMRALRASYAARAS